MRKIRTGMGVAAASVLLACQPTVSDEGGLTTDTGSIGTAAAAMRIDDSLSVIVIDGGAGPWTLEVTRDPAYGAFAFARAGADWRSAGYVSQTPGVSLERINGMDAIVFEDGAPDTARFTFEPYSGHVQATYTPRMPFSDGADAVFLGAFRTLPVADRAAVAALNNDPSNHPGTRGGMKIVLRSGRPVLFRGEVHEGEVDATGRAASYAYLGEAVITTGESFKGVVDPGLPDFLRDGLDGDLLRIFGALDDRFGQPLPDPASLLIAFRGYELEGLSLSGGVLPSNAMAFEISGDALRSEDPRIQPYLQRFFAHEATHLYQNVDGLRYAHPRHAWIGEGAAETMALQIAMELGLADAGVELEQYAENYALCDDALKGRTLEDAIRRGPEGNYDCGDLLMLFADVAIGQHGLADLWREMEAIVRARGEDAEYTADDHFAAIARLGAGDALIERMRAFTTETVANPHVELRAMSEMAGIGATFDGDTLTGFTRPESAR